ncbi:hypothetical protein PACTADRAFT_47496 [Pachysolen tannophilus NRRL Y-2460]|uniref:LisH domain-containing protein n=1 Tax=Pachysolen tannophilus NRRL Y-2460 TaxID=669874 RepID=A0A1E4U103_PACTA|nr:hypothetical protein PACTADRAFT_47496 [Pachysolen tannophilus NRRL Y-2460]
MTLEQNGLDDHIQLLVAQYLQANRHTKTLKQFEIEVDRPLSSHLAAEDVCGVGGKAILEESLESIIRDRMNFIKAGSTERDISNFSNEIHTPAQKALIEKNGLEILKWTLPYPNRVGQIDAGNGNSLVIHSSFVKMKIASQTVFVALFSMSNKTLLMIDLITKTPLMTYSNLHGNSVVGRIAIGIDGTNFIISCGMDGKAILCSIDGNYQLEKISEIQLHQRLVTSLKYLYINDEEYYLCSIGWDFKVKVHKLNVKNGTWEVIGYNRLLTNGTCMETFWFPTFNNIKYPLIIVGRLDSSLLSYFIIDERDKKLIQICSLSLNDSEFNNHSFHPTSMVITKTTDNNKFLITVGTNHIPYMRIITILLPDIQELINENPIISNEQNSIIMADISKKLSQIALTSSNEQSFANASSIPIIRNITVSNLNSLSPQDKYSNGIIISRSSLGKNGIYIAGDDGKIRGLDLKDGHIIELKGKTHEGRMKSMLLGEIDGIGEIIVSCGAIDKTIKIWECDSFELN